MVRQRAGGRSARAFMRVVCACAALCVSGISSRQAFCQEPLSFASAIRLAVDHSPRVRAAQNDLKKAQAGLAAARDMYIPSVVIGGGLGDAYGITLTVPTIFTVNAQSLVFSFQQRSYIRAAHTDIEAAQLALQEVKQQVEEDAAITYLSLDAAQETAAALNEQYDDAMRLAAIMQDRLKANLESELEVLKYRRGAIQIHLAKMQADDNAEDLRGHLEELTGTAPGELTIAAGSIPQIAATANFGTSLAPVIPDTPGILAAQASARAKEERARADAQYTWRPQIGFGATYGRVSPIENVSQFYNLNGIYNTISGGINIQLPILDRVRKAAAEESKLDALRAQMDLDSLRSDERANRHKLARSIPELNAKAELGDVNYEIAQQELAATEAESQHHTGAAIVTPKDVENARIEERQRYVDMLDAKLQARKARITLLRLTDQLDRWLSSLPGR